MILPFVTAVSTALGVTFLVAGLGKLRDRDGFVLAALDYQVLPPFLAVVYSRIVPLIEVTTGLGLILSVAPRLLGLVVSSLLLSFLVAVSVNIARRRPLHCHCFGSDNHQPIGGATIVRLLLLLVAAILATGTSPPTIWAIPLSSVVPVLTIATALALGIYMIGIMPEMYRIWHTKATPAVALNGGRISLRSSPMLWPGHQPVDISPAE